MRVCIIGACGHSKQAYRYLKTRKDVEICGMAPGCDKEGLVSSFDANIPFFESCTEMLERLKPDIAVVSPVFAYTGRIIIECANRGIDVFAEKPIAASAAELQAVEAAVKE